MLNEFRKQAIQYAAILKQYRGIDYETVNINVLADGYCKAMDEGNEQDKNLFVSGLILRFWFVIKKLQDKSPGMGLDITDFFNWLYESIDYACKYRKWQNPENKVNAQQCINQCIETIRLQHYYQANLKKHKGRFNTVSLDTLYENDGDDVQVSLLDTIADEEASTANTKLMEAADTRTFIQRYINRKKIIDAIILDNIAFGDNSREIKNVKKQVNTYVDEETGETTTEEEKITTYTSEFWEFRCVQNLSKLTSEYANYFLENYDVKPEELNAALQTIQKATNAKLYTYLRKCLEGCRASMGVK